MPKITKESLLADWCRNKVIFSKADLYRYGEENYYISAWRRVAEWVNEIPVRVKALTLEECAEKGLKGKMRWYEWIDTPTMPQIKAETGLGEAIAPEVEERHEAVYFERGKQLSFIG